ncbi:MAG: hypothetical protein WAL63_14465 [Solirubrobacteraceae bacterium]
MASRGKKVAQAVPFSAADLSNIAKANPYILRLIEDADLRDNIGAAIDSSKSAYARLASSKQVQKAILEDKKFQNDVKSAAEAIRDVSVALNEAPKKRKRKRHPFRVLFVLMLAAGVALAVSEPLRSKVLDMLFGSEEEFQYTPPAGTPAPQPPTSPVSAA